ncbi:MAG: inorganic diphosphatase [Patescibacteria group bacterium]
MSYSTQFLNKKVTVTVDRKMGTKHPKHNYFYPINYGYIAGVMAPDGHELDAYVLGVFKPVDTFEGMCIAVIHRLNDDDDKLIVVLEGKVFSDDEIRAIVDFQERFFTSEILRVS